MIPVRLVGGLPYVTIKISHAGKSLELENALLDTGSATTLISIERTNEINFRGNPEDYFREIFGVGGSESVICSRIDKLEIGKIVAEQVPIDLGGMDYGIPLDAIIGTDFLHSVGAVINLSDLILHQKLPS